MKKSKYNSQKTTVDGIIFDSKKEAMRYPVLKLRERAGDIQDLRLQVPFVLSPAVRIGRDKQFYLGDKNHVRDLTINQEVKYYADFVYIENGDEIVEDVKGHRTTKYTKKKNQMKKVYGIEIRET